MRSRFRFFGLRNAMTVLLLAGTSLLGACSSGPDPILTRTLTLQPEPGLNNDFPLAIDFVVVKDEALMGRLDATPAADWFARRAQFERDYPTAIRVLEWEMVPGATPLDVSVDKELPGAIGAFVFARYLTEGDHRGRVDQLRHAIVRLGPKGFEVQLAPTEQQ